MKKSVKTLVNSLMTVENGIRLIIATILLGPVALGFMLGTNLYAGIDGIQACFEVILDMFILISTPKVLAKAMTILNWGEGCSVSISVNWPVLVVCSLLALIASAAIADRMMLKPGLAREAFSVVMLIVILTIAIIYLSCWTVVLLKRIKMLLNWEE